MRALLHFTNINRTPQVFEFIYQFVVRFIPITAEAYNALGVTEREQVFEFILSALPANSMQACGKRSLLEFIL